MPNESVQDNIYIDKYFGSFNQSMIHYNLVVVVSSNPTTTHLKSTEDNEKEDTGKNETKEPQNGNNDVNRAPNSV